MSVFYDYSYRGDPGEFMRRVGRIPNLERTEEISLIKTYRESFHQPSLSRLYAAHQKLIVGLIKQAKLMPHFGDALGVGNVGLHQAIKKFDADKGNRLNTYAKWWIKAELSEMYGKTSIVKLSTCADDKKARVHLNKVLYKVVTPGKDPTERDFEEMAKRLGLPVDSVQKAYYGVHVGDVSIDGTYIRDSDEFGGLHETLADAAPLQDEILEQLDAIDEMRSDLTRAMEYLNERELRIFTARRLQDPPLTLEDLSAEFNVSRERVRQIEVRAFDKVFQVVHDGPSEKMVEEWQARRTQPAAEPAPV